MSLISVIVPVYKVEKYLDRCVESIVNQTYKDLEIILVDDGSPDSCPEMCDKWAKKDSRIKVIHKENGGAADAKNTGLNAATGELVGFVDADDYIFPDMYEHLYKIMVEYDADIVDSQIRLVNENELTDYEDKIEKILVYNAEQALDEFLNDKFIRQTPPNKLYKKTVIGDIRFVKGKYIDDEYWTYKVIGNCKKYIFTTKEFYCYVQHNESAMGRNYTLKRLDAIDAKQERYLYMHNKYPNLELKAIKGYAGTLRYHYQYISRVSEIDKDKINRKNLYKRFSDVYSHDLYKDIKLKYKIWLFLFRLNPDVYSYIRNKLKIGL